MDTTTVALPLGGEATVRGMRGRDEDLLANQKKVESGEAMTDIIANCTVTLRERENIGAEDIDDLKSPDRLALLLAIRTASYGAEVEADLQCDNERCGNKFQVVIDLTAVESKPLPKEYTDAGFVVTLKTGEVVTFDYTSGKDEKKLAAAPKDALLTAMLQARLKKVEGVHGNALKKWLQDAPVKTRRALREAMEKVECGPDVVRTADCPSCGTENQFQAHGVPGFFYPR